MNIFDCFMYFDEDLILDLRLNILNKYVKKFIITESTYLHSGREKKLNFDPKKFLKFKDKIEYIVIDKPPKGIEKINADDPIEIKNKKFWTIHSKEKIIKEITKLEDYLMHMMKI